MKTTTTAVVLVLMLLLVACGGSDDSDDAAVDVAEAAPTAIEATATATEEPPDEPVDEPEESAPDPTPSSEAAPVAGASAGGFSMNGFRYCEILLTYEGDDGVPVTEVWGTPGVSQCEDEDWYAIDPGAIAVEYDASDVYLNGPRYFTVDGATDTDPAAAAAGAQSGAEVRTFGEVPMTLLATVAEQGEDAGAYVPDTVVRTTTWTFAAGTEVYELTDPEGNTYFMQSYSLIHDRGLTAADLPSFGERLELPEGWTYGARVLDEGIQLGLAPEGAIVVTDELANAYQRNG